MHVKASVSARMSLALFSILLFYSTVCFHFAEQINDDDDDEILETRPCFAPLRLGFPPVCALSLCSLQVTAYTLFPPSRRDSPSKICSKDPDVCRITHKMLWIHYLVGVSHFAECRENRPATV